MSYSFFILSSMAAVFAVAPLPASGQPPEPGHEATERTEDALLEVPPSMAEEHEALHASLAAAVAAGGRTGEAARALEARLAPHFEEENRYALPPLGLLPHLARGAATEAMRPAIAMARHVEQNLDRFLEEHRNIRAALDELERAAETEGKAEQVRFAAELRRHAQQEEELFYPMTIVIGRYLNAQLGAP